MRTTLTIDQDNAVRLENLRKQRDSKLKDVVNDALRRGLDQIETSSKRAPFHIKPVDLGAPRFRNPEELKELIAQLDEEEDLRKLGLE